MKRLTLTIESCGSGRPTETRSFRIPDRSRSTMITLRHWLAGALREAGTDNVWIQTNEPEGDILLTDVSLEPIMKKASRWAS